MPGEREQEASQGCATGIAMREVRSGYFASRHHSTLVNSRFHQGGFTLIEILVVVAVLGVLSVIVILNVLGLIGSGAVESANTEAHQVQQAVIAHMHTEDIATWSGIVDESGTTPVSDYILNPGSLQARYTVTDGKIADAYAYPDGKWSSLTWPTGEWGLEEGE